MRMKGWSLGLTIIGLVLIALMLVWLLAVFPTMVKLPEDHHRVINFEGTYMVLNPDTQALDEIQIALGKRQDSFRRDIQDIEGKIKTLEQGDIYVTYEDSDTLQAISNLKEKIAAYEDLIDEYEDLAEWVGREARTCRTHAATVSTQAGQSYTFSDTFFAYGKEILQPPTSLAIGLALLIVALIGLAAGKGRYVALAFLVLVLIFLGVSAVQLLR